MKHFYFQTYSNASLLCKLAKKKILTHLPYFLSQWWKKGDDSYRSETPQHHEEICARKPLDLLWLPQYVDHTDDVYGNMKHITKILHHGSMTQHKTICNNPQQEFDRADDDEDVLDVKELLMVEQTFPLLRVHGELQNHGDQGYPGDCHHKELHVCLFTYISFQPIDAECPHTLTCIGFSCLHIKQPRENYQRIKCPKLSQLTVPHLYLTRTRRILINIFVRVMLHISKKKDVLFFKLLGPLTDDVTKVVNKVQNT